VPTIRFDSSPLNDAAPIWFTLAETRNCEHSLKNFWTEFFSLKLSRLKADRKDAPHPLALVSAL